MKILITGGAGFIGSHICKQLLDGGHFVVVFDNLSKSSQSSVDPRAEFVKGDISDEQLLVKSLADCEAVIHMAALIEVNESVKQPGLFAENNIIGGLHLLEAMRSAGVKRIVFSSSATVYGSPQQKDLPLTETAPVLSANPYGATKVAMENFLNSYHLIYGFDVTILRYFNPYGPGEDHQPETHAIPNFIKAALAKQPIPLYWQGQQVRDFIYVEDLAAAHLAVIDLKGWNIFNVGSDNGVKVSDVLSKISEILGYELKTQDMGQRAGDVPALYASSKLLHDETSWQAKVDLDDGLRRTIEWFKTRV